jgi:hypothetical protein
MEETLEGGRGPPRAVVPLEREREKTCIPKIYLDFCLKDEIPKGCFYM